MEETGLPPEIRPDDMDGLGSSAVSETGDEDELTAHGPDGDGNILAVGADAEGLLPIADDVDDEDYDESDETDDFWTKVRLLRLDVGGVSAGG
jgi:hypothetical protein